MSGRLGVTTEAGRPVLRGLEVIQQIRRLGGNFCGDHGASTPPPSYSQPNIFFFNFFYGQRQAVPLVFNILCQLMKDNFIDLSDLAYLQFTSVKNLNPYFIYSSLKFNRIYKTTLFI